MAEVALYDRESVIQLHFPKTSSGRLAADYFVPIVKNGTKSYIDNVDQPLLIAKVDNEIVPLVINNGEQDQCYLTSPIAYYIHYVADFIRTINHKPLRISLQLLIAGLKHIFGFLKLNRVVYVNNWLLPTGPFLALERKQIDLLIKKLSCQFPRHAIVFKGCTEAAHEQLNRMTATGLLKIVHRQVYTWDQSTIEDINLSTAKQRRTFKTDQKFLKNTPYQLSCMNGKHAEKLDYSQALCNLYRELYVKKYSRYSLQYNDRWFQHTLASECFNFVGFFHKASEQTLQGFISYYKSEQQLISSLVGHQTLEAKDTGLYRCSISYLCKQSKEENLPVNLSSGAGEFKRRRGAKPSFEFDFVYIHHLSKWQQLGWRLLALMYNTLAKKIFTTMKV
ncbi:hypothetical protein [Zooshikella sp. RANM57]|uniref:hypothetical protein n=1 Tax=Zooshikella sp. RANM57 TaxID=3425863 RepID=UPI003D6EAB73